MVATSARAVVGAATIDTDGDVKLAWNNEFRLSGRYAAHRVSTGAPGYDSDGNGFDQARLDWLTDLDADGDVAGLGEAGIRLSAAGWHEIVSRGVGDGALGILAYAKGAAYYEVRLSPPARGDVALFDAFAHDAFAFGDDQRLSFRVGRHVSLWGESVYFPANGIAGGQAPLDTSRLEAAASYADGAMFAPVGQASVSWQPEAGLAIDGYYQFEYRADRTDSGPGNIDGAYAYGQIAELDPAARRLVESVLYGAGPVMLARMPDRTPGGGGQFGLGVRWRGGGVDYGLYALKFSAKSPILAVVLPGQLGPGQLGPGQSGRYRTGTYDLFYPTDIELYGASVAGSVGDASVGAEISARRNMPLVTAGIFVPAGFVSGAAPARPEALYPAGDTLHAQLSWTYVTPPLPGVPDGANWTGEIAGNALVSVTANPGRIMPGRTRAAGSLRTVFEPQFLSVFPRVDITLPLAIGYNFAGRSATDPAMNRGAGDISIGLTATLDQSWRAALILAHSFGRPDTASAEYYSLDPGYTVNGFGDFVSVAVKRKF